MQQAAASCFAEPAYDAGHSAPAQSAASCICYFTLLYLWSTRHTLAANMHLSFIHVPGTSRKSAGGGAAYELSLSGRELRPHACMAPCLATCLQMSDTLLRQLALQCRASSRTLLQQGLLPGQVATLAKPHLNCTQTLLHAGPAGRRVARPLAAQSSAVLAALSRCFCCLQEGLSPREMAV